jgi:hypothetical protein
LQNICPKAEGGGLYQTFRYESYDTGKEITMHLSEAIARRQRDHLAISPFFTIQADGSTDKGKIKTLTIDVRYWDVAKQRVVTEFLGVVKCGGKATDITNKIADMLTKALPDWKRRLVGGSFDGASNMMGNVTGVQTQLKSICPWSVYIHCAAHRCALALKSATPENAEIEEFIDTTLPALYNSIVNASTRSDFCKEQQVACNEPVSKPATDQNGAILPLQLVSTRWLSAAQAAARVREITRSVCATVEKFCDDSTELVALQETLTDATTIALIHVLPDILNLPATFSERMQHRDVMVSHESLVCPCLSRQENHCFSDILSRACLGKRTCCCRYHCCH